jgi:GNAT superfamily N-acetyltransferase
VLEEHALDPVAHDRPAFTCGVPALDEYLHRFADQHKRRGISAAYVMVDSAAPAAILGYYTLSAAEVDADRLGAADRKRLPRYPMPCFRLGRLAISQGAQGQGLGKLLMACAVDRCLKARQQVAAYALVVDAKDEGAKAFYQHFGFKPLVDATLTLYLPLGR